MGLNIKTDKMLRYFGPGYNQKLGPVSAVNRGYKNTDRSDSGGKRGKDHLYNTIGANGFDLETDKNM